MYTFDIKKKSLHYSEGSYGRPAEASVQYTLSECPVFLLWYFLKKLTEINIEIDVKILGRTAMLYSVHSPIAVTEWTEEDVRRIKLCTLLLASF